MDDTLIKEFSLINGVRLEVSRCNFENLGSIIEISIQSNRDLTIGFYDEKKNRIKGLIFLSKTDYNVFENLYFFPGGTEKLSIKLMNKEIYYLKMFLFAKKKKFFILDVFNMASLDNIEMNGEEMVKYDNIEEILEEISRVNNDLISEKDSLEKSKQNLRIKEEKISSMILGFKKEIYLQYDKTYNDIVVKMNSKIAELSKKLQITENNLINKVRILKEKPKDVKTNKVEKIVNPNKDKANFEIKIKVLEDSLNQMKTKLNEKDELIKSLQEAEDKYQKQIKRLKDDNAQLCLKLKQKEEKKEQPIENKNDKIEEKKEVKKEIKKRFEAPGKKETIEILSSLVSSLLYDSFVEKDLGRMAMLILNVTTNPINLYHNSNKSFIYLTKKILNYIMTINNKNLLQGEINSIFNSYPELRKDLCAEVTKDKSESSAILNITYNEKKLNEMIINRTDYFNTFLTKNEKKYEKDINNHKITECANIVLQLLFLSEPAELIKRLRMILTIISNLYEKNIHSPVMSYIINIKLFDFLIYAINIHVNFNNSEIYKIIIDMILFFNHLGYNLNVLNYFNEINLQKYIDINTLDNNSNAILFLSLVPQIPNAFKNKLNEIYNNTKLDIIKKNIELILTK
jgi:hypothetical protein